jgi:hypothetical protein
MLLKVYLCEELEIVLCCRCAPNFKPRDTIQEVQYSTVQYSTCRPSSLLLLHQTKPFSRCANGMVLLREKQTLDPAVLYCRWMDGLILITVVL